MFGGKGIRRLLPTGINGDQFKTFILPTTPKRTFPVCFSIYSISYQRNINVSPSIESSGTLSVILKVRQ